MPNVEYNWRSAFNPFDKTVTPRQRATTLGLLGAGGAAVAGLAVGIPAYLDNDCVERPAVIEQAGSETEAYDQITVDSDFDRMVKSIDFSKMTPGTDIPYETILHVPHIYTPQTETINGFRENQIIFDAFAYYGEGNATSYRIGCFVSQSDTKKFMDALTRSTTIVIDKPGPGETVRTPFPYKGMVRQPAVWVEEGKNGNTIWVADVDKLGFFTSGSFDVEMQDPVRRGSIGPDGVSYY